MPSPSVVYLALGARRVQAATRLTARVAADGADVLLVIPDSDAWKNVEPAPGVTLRRLPGSGPQAAARAARRLLLGAPAGSVLVAGDPPALPVVEAVGRRRPDLSVVVEPDAASGRRPAAADLAVLTPWYPSPNDDFAGAFVRATTAAVRDEFPRVSVLHTEGWFYPAEEAARFKVEAAAHRINAVTVVDTEPGELSRIAVPSVTSAGYPAWMDDHVRALRAALPTGRIEAPVVHAHTGMYGGVAAAALARPDARVVMTEHATFLPRVFRRPGARRRYATALHRADAVLCVGPGLRDYLAAEFPRYVGKLHVVPNPIDFDAFAVRDRPPADLRRWLYVGRLVEQKGVRLLLEAFGVVAADDPALTLTLVGSGALAAELGERAAALGVGDRVRLQEPVPPDQVPALLAEHDLLVHLSSVETFGLTVVEAIATGTPVLAARNDGTQQTMAGLDGLAGLLIDPGADPSAVAHAYRDLRRRLPDLDLRRARDELLARYGREAVAARLRHFYTGNLERPEPASDHAVVPRPRAEAASRPALRRVPDRVLDRLLATARQRPGPGLEIAVRRVQRTHQAVLRRWSAASAQLPRR
jgi:glycosyltransferase involved in cell wall biosynthesis